MSAFNISMLQALTGGLGYGIGYLFTKTSLKLWRVFVGFFVSFVVSWIGGIIFWQSVFMPNERFDAIVGGMPKSFLVAIVGSGIGVYAGRRKAKIPVSEIA